MLVVRVERVGSVDEGEASGAFDANLFLQRWPACTA